MKKYINTSYDYNKDSEQYLGELEYQIQNLLDEYDSDLDILLNADRNKIYVDVLFGFNPNIDNHVTFSYDISLISSKYGGSDGLANFAEYIANDIFEQIYVNE